MRVLLVILSMMAALPRLNAAAEVTRRMVLLAVQGVVRPAVLRAQGESERRAKETPVDLPQVPPLTAVLVVAGQAALAEYRARAVLAVQVDRLISLEAPQLMAVVVAGAARSGTMDLVTQPVGPVARAAAELAAIGITVRQPSRVQPIRGAAVVGVLMPDRGELSNTMPVPVVRES